MDNSRPFVPGFMKKIDRSLLLNQPTVWSMRTHLVLFFGICFAAVLALLCALLYADARQYSSVGIMTGFVIVIAAVGLIFWLIYLLRFNVFKRYGEWKIGDGLKIFFLLLFNVSIFISLPFIPANVEAFMANRQFSNAELTNDVNEINVTIAKLEYDKLNKQWESDTTVVIPYGNSSYRQAQDAVADTATVGDAAQHIRRERSEITQEDLKSRLEGVDSVKKINEKLYIFYDGPQYNFLSLYNFYRDGKGEGLLTSKGIYNKVIHDYKSSDKDLLMKRMEYFKEKYKSGSTSYSSYGDISSNYMNEIVNKYKLDEIKGTMEMIVSKKYSFAGDNSWAWRVLYYCTLFFTLLIFIFRHSTPKTFFLTALSAIVLAIITGLFIAVSNARETGIFMIMIVYFIIFALISFSIFSASVRSLWRGIALNLFMFTLPVMPLIVTGYYWFTRDEPYHNIDAADQKAFLYAEITGFVLLVILIEPLFRRLYRAWYAAPEE